MSLRTIGIALAVLVIIAVGFFAFNRAEAPTGIACTLDAMQCPDGSYVGRVGPDCHFAVCPMPSTPATWKTKTDTTTGITFNYPPNLGTTYISTVDWPPKAKLKVGVFSCLEAGSPQSAGGHIQLKTINGKPYCVTVESEGAAGSIYTNYAYITAHGADLLTFTFALRFPQCANYDQPKMGECLAERATFSIDSIIAQIAGTVSISAPSSISGIKGRALLGPTCPVERIPPDPACADRPYQGTLQLTTADGLQVLDTFSSAVDGTFALIVSPGTYAIRSSGNGLPRCSSNGTIHVSANAFVQANVSCDTGIR